MQKGEYLDWDSGEKEALWDRRINRPWFTVQLHNRIRRVTSDTTRGVKCATQKFAENIIFEDSGTHLTGHPTKYKIQNFGGKLFFEIVFSIDRIDFLNKLIRSHGFIVCT